MDRCVRTIIDEVGKNGTMVEPKLIESVKMVQSGTLLSE